MALHVRILGWIYIVSGGLSLLFVLGIAAMMFLAGGAAATTPGSPDGPSGASAAAMLGGMGMIVIAVGAVFALPSLVTGWGLLQGARWARIVGILMSIVSLIGFPIGTAIGIYGLVILFNPETVALFDSPQFTSYS